MMELNPYEVPTARSLVNLAVKALDPITKYMCLWSAFDNIYTTVADRRGIRPALRVDESGEPIKADRGEVQVWQVDAPREAEKLRIVFKEFSKELRERLVMHRSTRFFVYRTPHWQGHELDIDAEGQKINGVINVGRTVDPLRPVWSPISIEAYERVLSGAASDDDLDLVSNQILWLLYTVRNNIMHGGKRADDANDVEVADNALVLLQEIVYSFVPEAA